jgi:GrpB-like predicted nucleotidyltransferase (UPF0157 family)
MRKVEVVSYSIEWPARFEEESHRIRSIFGSEIIAIHHIGSTAVPNLSAKPVIDIMPVVKNIERVDDYNHAMINLGYEPRGENGLSGRRYFQKGEDQRTHHVHIYEKDNSDIDRHLVFRDYLRSHPEEAINYGSLKEGLAKEFPYDITSYIEGKEALVLEIEQKAMVWSK